MVCESCGNKCPKRSKFCPNCGSQMGRKRLGNKSGKKKKRHVVLKVIGIVLGISLLICFALGVLLNHFYMKPCSWTYTYDENGRMLSETMHEKDGTVRYRYECICDSEGNVVTKNGYGHNGDLFGWSFLSYDQDGNLLTETSYNSNGEIIQHEEYTYDGYGNNLSYICYYGDELNAQYDYSYEYNEAGNVLKKIWYVNGEFEWQETYTYEYNVGGDVVKRISDNGSVRTYDSNGNIIYARSDHFSAEYTYDDMGNKLSYSMYYDGELREEETYSYDKYGNMILKTYDSSAHERRNEDIIDRVGSIISWVQYMYEEYCET